MKIQIIRRQCGGTEFYPSPHRLHLGAQNAAGVDELHFSLPEEWAGCTCAAATAPCLLPFRWKKATG